MAQDISKTYTVEDLVKLGPIDDVTYTKFSLLTNLSNIQIPSQNIIFDYMDEMEKLAVNVYLTETEYQRYKYKPKLLSYDIYGTTEAYFVIMALNNIIDVRDFTMKKLKMLKRDALDFVLGSIYTANENLINQNRVQIEKESELL